MVKVTREQVAWRAAQDLREGACVNLGIGIPTLAANFVPKDREVIFHSENGILGLGPRPTSGMEDPNLIDAGKSPATLAIGGCYKSHCHAFLVVRRWHLALEVVGVLLGVEGAVY